MPGVGLGGELTVRALRGPLAAEVGYTRWLNGTTHDAMDDIALDVGLSAMTVRLGWQPRALPIGAWLVGDLGSMTGVESFGIDRHALSGRWLATGAGVGIAWSPWRDLGLYGRFEVLDVVERTQFRVSSGSALYEPAAATARVSIGAEVTWR